MPQSRADWGIAFIADERFHDIDEHACHRARFRRDLPQPPSSSRSGELMSRLEARLGDRPQPETHINSPHEQVRNLLHDALMRRRDQVAGLLRRA